MLKYITIIYNYDINYEQQSYEQNILDTLPASQETFLNKQNAFLPSLNKLVKPLHPCNIWHIVLSCATIKINQIVLLMNCKKLHCAYDITTFNKTRYNIIINVKLIISVQYYNTNDFSINYAKKVLSDC